MRTHAAVAVHHLVENAGQRPVACNEMLERRRLVVRRRCRVEWPWRDACRIFQIDRRRSSVVGYSSERFERRNVDQPAGMAVILEAGAAARLPLRRN